MDADSHLPEGYGSITPYFTVEDADLLIAFLASVFGAEIIKEARYPDQGIQHARLQIGTSVIMLNESNDDYAANRSQMHVFVPDTDACYRAALEAGASSIMEPNMRPHGDQMAGIEDPCGNIWWIATHRPG